MISTEPSFLLPHSLSRSICLSLSLCCRYYLDYQNRRPEYVEKWMYKLVNWDFVAENLDNALPESKKNNKGSTSSDDGGEEQKKEAATTTDEEDEL